eukprot:GHVU01207732.1.p1 GENE.GHVU01207732.1~~GHVU01207732.1.p1  ORF type:complete len:165 (-),score=8.79 GHVU01207732.1:40-534(-)
MRKAACCVKLVRVCVCVCVGAHVRVCAYVRVGVVEHMRLLMMSPAVHTLDKAANMLSASLATITASSAPLFHHPSYGSSLYLSVIDPTDMRARTYIYTQHVHNPVNQAATRFGVEVLAEDEDTSIDACVGARVWMHRASSMCLLTGLHACIYECTNVCTNVFMF